MAFTVVTFNLRDFPSDALSDFEIEAVHPDDFVVQQLHLSLSKVLETARKHRARLKRIEKSADQYLDTLEQQKLPKTVSLLREYSDLI